jgi:hypothetical protein
MPMASGNYDDRGRCCRDIDAFFEAAPDHVGGSVKIER